MRLESTIIERVETFVHHPVFAGSDQAMDLVLAGTAELYRGPSEPVILGSADGIRS